MREARIIHMEMKATIIFVFILSVISYDSVMLLLIAFSIQEQGV